MDILQELHGQVLLVAPSGRLDSETAGELELVLDDAGHAGRKHFVIDLAAVVYVSSAGLRVLLALAKRLDGGIGREQGAVGHGPFGKLPAGHRLLPQHLHRAVPRITCNLAIQAIHRPGRALQVLHEEVVGVEQHTRQPLACVADAGLAQQQLGLERRQRSGGNGFVEQPGHWLHDTSRIFKRKNP